MYSVDLPDRIKILVADDPEMIAACYRAPLCEQGYEVAAACNQQETMDMCRSFYPDIVLLDNALPPGDSYRLIGRIKQEAGTAIVPVVLVTTPGAFYTQARGLEHGADEFLSKPFCSNELIARVRSVVRCREVRGALTAAQAMGTTDLADDEDDRPASGEVLLVTGNPGMAQQVARMLTSAGHSVTARFDGRSILGKGDNQRPALILIDLDLPDIDGLELLGQLRAGSQLRDVPVVVLVPEPELRDRIHEPFVGADDYLVKPAEPLQLFTRVDANIRKYRYRKMLKKIQQSGLRQPWEPRWNAA